MQLLGVLAELAFQQTHRTSGIAYRDQQSRISDLLLWVAGEGLLQLLEED